MLLKSKDVYRSTTTESANQKRIQPFVPIVKTFIFPATGLQESSGKPRKEEVQLSRNYQTAEATTTGITGSTSTTAKATEI